MLDVGINDKSLTETLVITRSDLPPLQAVLFSSPPTVFAILTVASQPGDSN